jgi:hypothetical protein
MGMISYNLLYYYNCQTTDKIYKFYHLKNTRPRRAAMNISDITSNLEIRTYTPQSAGEKIRALPTSGELVIILIQKSLEKPTDKTAEAVKSDKVDIIT